jgi:hypothetical protein
MAKPQNREQLKEYCLRRLGFPVIEINVDEDQLEDRIDDALTKFQLFHYDGVEKVYYKHLVTQDDIDNRYIPCPNSIVSVVRVFPLFSSEVNSINNSGNFNMFDLTYQLRLNELFDFTSADYVYFTLAQQHIRTLEMLFIGETPIRFNRRNNKIFVDFNWEGKIAPGRYLVFEAYQILDPSANDEIWSTTWLKNYTTALFKRQWGENLKKFSGVALPGGITLNGQQIYEEAAAEVEKLEEELRESYEEPPGFLLG